MNLAIGYGLFGHMDLMKALHRLLRSDFDIEAGSGFSQLSRVPDTRVRHFLDYYKSLDPSRQDALANTVTFWGAIRVAGAGPDSYDMLKTDATFNEWSREMVQGVGRDRYYYYGVPSFRLCVAQDKIDRAKGGPSSVPKDFVDYALSIKSIKTPELSKRVSIAMEQLFGRKFSKKKGGGLEFAGELSGAEVTGWVDYSGRFQLKYQVCAKSVSPPLQLGHAGYDTALGGGLGQWNFIVEENVDDAIEFLTESVTYIAALPQRLASRI